MYEEDFEDLYNYYEEIFDRANSGKDSQIKYLDNILNKNLMIDLKKDEFEKVFKYYQKRLNLRIKQKIKEKLKNL